MVIASDWFSSTYIVSFLHSHQSDFILFFLITANHSFVQNSFPCKSKVKSKGHPLACKALYNLASWYLSNLICYDYPFPATQPPCSKNTWNRTLPLHTVSFACPTSHIHPRSIRPIPFFPKSLLWERLSITTLSLLPFFSSFILRYFSSIPSIMPWQTINLSICSRSTPPL